jgi:short-subunit dehydrogenase
LATSLRDKVVIITGASTGIGRAVALQLARKKAKLVLAARSTEKLYQLQIEIERLGAECMVAPSDVRNQVCIDHLIEGTVARFGGIDVLINNAGYGLWGVVEKLPMDEIRSVFETNLFGAIAVAKAVIPEMKKRGGGQIINVESVVALRSLPGSGAYCATKHALHAFSEAMRSELAPHGIHVCSFCPGITRSDFSKNRVEIDFHTEFSKTLSMSSERCAEIMIRAIEWRRRQVVTTWSGKLLHLMQRLSPRMVDWMMIAGQKLRLAP